MSRLRSGQATCRGFRFLHLAIACSALFLVPAAGAKAALPSLPNGEQLVSLPEGAWLALRDRGVELIDALGTTRAKWSVRGESLDARAFERRGSALVVDSNTQHVAVLDVDLDSFTLKPRMQLPDAGQTVSAACLFRDRQGLLHAFVLGKNGVAHQWLLHGNEALSVRQLALAPDAESCRGDDEGEQILVSEAGGVWAYRAEAEGISIRTPVALARPHGPLAKGGGPLAVLPGGVAIADPGRGELLLFERPQRGRSWPAVGAIALRPRGEPSQLVAWSTDSTVLIGARSENHGQWISYRVKGRAVKKSAVVASPPIVLPRIQTAPVAQYGDAADDPAIWVHAKDPTRSLVLGTDKKRGLGIYDLEGREVQFLAIGRLNNVDVRQDVHVGADRGDFAVATHRDDNSVVVLRIDTDGGVREAGRVATDLADIYGICAYRSAQHYLEAFVNDKSGRFVHLRFEVREGYLTGRVLREFRVATQPEGCVVDDRAQRLFLGEEKRGVWTTRAEAPSTADAPLLQKVLSVGPILHADVEGMALYQQSASSYLVVSSQGNDTYVVLDAAPPFKVRGAFRIGLNASAAIDGASETDGIEVISLNLGGRFPRGMLVVQDGFKTLPAGPQNFKYVSWEDIAILLGLD